jgi:TPR repeat protein
MFATGTGGAPQDLEKAHSLWRLSCDGGFAPGCTLLADAAASENQWSLALLYSSKACVGGDARGCTDLGVLALYGEGTTRSRSRARSLFSYACSLGEPQGCSMDAWMSVDEGGPASARDLLASECRDDHHSGCAGLGLLLEHGIGGPSDLRAALRAYLEGCDAGEPAACVFAGVLIEERSSRREHHRRAQVLYETGCSAPLSEPCWIDESARARWRNHFAGDAFERRACEGPRARALACYNAALGYERGIGVAVDGDKAQERLDQSCQQGFLLACRPASAYVLH